MKLTGAITCAVLAVLLVSPLAAQPHRQALPKFVADVPFDFMVDHVMFPGGKYAITVAGDRTFSLRASHGRESVNLRLEPIETNAGAARLIFAEENGHFYLRELWTNSTGGEVAGRPIEQLQVVRASRVEVPLSCSNCQ